VIALQFPTLQAQFQGPAKALLPWLEDPSVTDIFINGTESVYTERNGENQKHESPFRSTSEVLELVERMVVPLGKRIDASRPYLDGALCNGARFHLVLSPISDPGPAISIRKFRPIETIGLESFGQPIHTQTLKKWVAEKRNFIVGGATGAGKTTLLGCLLGQVPQSERVILIEECAEIQSPVPHTLRLVARPPTPDGKGEVTLRELVRNSLRMRPDRLIVGECRGAEVLDFLQAMSTGHSGCMGTLHAQSARDGLQRLETLVAISGVAMERSAVKQWIASAVGGVVFLKRGPGGRQITEMAEVRGWEGEHFRLLPIELES
jgi:pilus assembly protein CpaF